jgi:hypothetical protein
MNAEPTTPLAAAAQSLLVFATAVTMFFIALLIKVIIKRPARADRDQWREATFDIFRVGPDLALLGFSTYLTVYELAWGQLGGAPEYLLKLNALLIPIQLLMLLAIIALMSYHDSARGSWFWGVYVPLFIGGLSILLSLAALVASYVGPSQPVKSV